LQKIKAFLSAVFRCVEIPKGELAKHYDQLTSC